MGRQQSSKILRPREFDIVYLAHFGFKNEHIAIVIGTTEHVVKNYLRTIFDKLGIDNRVELTLWYFANEALVLGEMYDEST